MSLNRHEYEKISKENWKLLNLAFNLFNKLREDFKRKLKAIAFTSRSEAR